MKISDMIIMIFIFAPVIFWNSCDIGQNKCSITELSEQVTKLQEAYDDSVNERSELLKRIKFIQDKINHEIIPQINNNMASQYGERYCWFNSIDPIPSCTACHKGGLK